MIKALLRSYEGIFDQEVAVHERTLSYLLRLAQQEIIAQLQQLHAFGIVRYQPQKDTPQLFFIQNRVKAEDLTIDMRSYNERKELYKTRVAAFISYVNGDACRSQSIGRYFGDEHIQPCGVCDSCLKLKKSSITKEDFYLIEQRILAALHWQPLGSKDLLQVLQGIAREKVWKVIEFLQAEKRIHVNQAGLIVKV